MNCTTVETRILRSHGAVCDVALSRADHVMRKQRGAPSPLGDRFSNWMSGELRIRKQRWLGLILILSRMRHHPNDLFFFFFLSHYSLFFCFFFYSYIFFFYHTFSCFMLSFFYLNHWCYKFAQRKMYLTDKCDVMIWLCVYVQQGCVYMCVPVVRLCSMYRPGLMEENSSSFFKIRTQLDYT